MHVMQSSLKEASLFEEHDADIVHAIDPVSQSTPTYVRNISKYDSAHLFRSYELASPVPPTPEERVMAYALTRELTASPKNVVEQSLIMDTVHTRRCTASLRAGCVAVFRRLR